MQVIYEDEKLSLREKESVLDCLLRNQKKIPHSCRSGICQGCLMQAVDSRVPEQAQKGLKPSYKKMNLFLACRCFPIQDIRVQLPGSADISVAATILEKTLLNQNVLRLRLQPQTFISCSPGQYLTVISPAQVARSYSVANIVKKDRYIEFHIRIYPQGIMSTWLSTKASIGDPLSLRGPAGYCFYTGEEGREFPIILAGTGTGLAPLYGILIDALDQGHQGNITLYHGALREEDLYFVERLNNLAKNYSSFFYHPCVLDGKPGKFYTVGNIEEIVLDRLPENKSSTRLYLCGAPEFVNSLKVKAFLAGLASKNIHVDAFLPTKDLII